jgi:hypothetical protein
MKLLVFSFISFLFLVPACKDSKQEDSDHLKAAELNQREEAVRIREQLVQQKEQELLRREQVLDSTLNKVPDSVLNKQLSDSLFASRPHIPGVYNVTMKCTETNCTGSAVGDTKNEQWEIAYEQNFVVIRAMSDNRVVRLYKGKYLGGPIELEAQQDSSTTSPVGKIIVRLQETKDNQLEGVREITRQDDCRVIYDLDLKKQ